MKFPEIQDALLLFSIQAEVCLLDAKDQTISKRILGRYMNEESVRELDRTTGKTPEKFSADNVWIASQFRMQAKELGCHTVDTSNLSPEEVGEDVVNWITSN